MSVLIVYMQKVCLKSLQEDAADYINRQHFSDAGFLGALRVKNELAFFRGFSTTMFAFCWS